MNEWMRECDRCSNFDLCSDIGQCQSPVDTPADRLRDLLVAVKRPTDGRIWTWYVTDDKQPAAISRFRDPAFLIELKIWAEEDGWMFLVNCDGTWFTRGYFTTPEEVMIEAQDAGDRVYAGQVEKKLTA